MDRYGGTQQRYLISGPLYCVLYNSWKWLECTVWHVFLWRISLWIENEPITDRNVIWLYQLSWKCKLATVMSIKLTFRALALRQSEWLGANLVLRASHLPAQPLPLWYKRKMRHPGNLVDLARDRPCFPYQDSNTPLKDFQDKIANFSSISLFCN